ncbi:Cna B-type domain-containing protein, partial [Eubacterium pyruvativorans]|uniref:Cna B-type domain-containing protein n=1 Tax=Eubacterium pyruvativorans TaxID=155865 RepID=UPI003F8A3B81
VPGYTTQNNTAANGETITNKAETTSVTITKKWEDNNNEAGNRPDANEFKSCIKLMNGQTEVTGYEPEVTDNKNGTYTVKYSGLPKTENGKYTVQEDNVPGYTTQNNTAANGETITNKAETTSVTITKKWEDNNNTAGNRPSAEEFKSKIRLMNGQTEVTEYKLDVTDNGNGTYTVKYTGLPKMENGKEVKYTVREDEVPGYTTQNNAAANGETITNKAETTSVTITKKWEDNNNAAGNRPSVEVFESMIKLMNGENEVTGHGPYITDNGNGTYTVKYTGLPKMENGKEVKYTVQEDNVPGYTTQNNEAENNGIITNTIKPDKPANPATPMTPDKPTNPATPTTPDKPTNPATPTIPDNPTTPTTPDKPANPATPMTPDKPTNPAMPTTPDKPTTPDQPTTPDKPTNPDKPTTPDKPTNPDKPTTPDKPAIPDKPTNPDKPNRNGSFPQTGDNSNLPLYAAAFAVSAVGLGVLLIARRKKNHEVK